METKQTLSQFICSCFRSTLSLRQVRDRAYEKYNELLSANTVRTLWIKTYSKKRYIERMISLRGFNVQKEREIRKYKRKNFQVVRLRDKICQECGNLSNKLDVHHIVPRRLFERYDFEQHDIDNLMLLCDKCHATLGQQLDNVMIDLFEQFIRFINPHTSDFILHKLWILKKYKPKLSPGAPKKYTLTKTDLLQFKNIKGQVDINLVKQKYFEVPIYHVVKVCRESNLIFKIDYKSEYKFIQTKICPVCTWSGAAKVVSHIFDTNDNNHQQLLDKLKQLYLDGNSCEDIAKMYVDNNFTKVIVEDIINRLGVMKQINLSNRQCPVCEWSGLYFLKHLIEVNDEKHVAFKRKIENMYFQDKKSATLISKELNCDKKFVYNYITQIKKGT